MAGLSRMVALTRSSRPALNMAVRVVSTSTQLRIKEQEIAILPGFAKIKEKQKAFAVDDGLRVHEKGGQSDKILYHLTTVLVLIGLYEWCRPWPTPAGKPSSPRTRHLNWSATDIFLQKI